MASGLRQRLSPGWQTHLMFAEFDGEVVEHADHIVVRTPESPGYYWGNFLLYDRLPGNADFGPWMSRFDQAIVQHAPGTGHRSFGMHARATQFDAPPAFADAGFMAFGVATLTLQAHGLRAPPPAPALLPGKGLQLRPLHLPAEAEPVVDLNMACNDEGYEPEGYREFRQAQMQRYGRMVQCGMGHQWGVLHQGAVVATLGLFGGRGVGRFQHVETHPDWRRRGLCSALMHAACRHGFEHMGWHTLVIGADPDDVAIGLYQSLGFAQHDTLWMLERRPPEDTVADAG